MVSTVASMLWLGDGKIIGILLDMKEANTVICDKSENVFKKLEDIEIAVLDQDIAEEVEKIGRHKVNWSRVLLTQLLRRLSKK